MGRPQIVSDFVFYCFDIYLPLIIIPFIVHILPLFIFLLYIYYLLPFIDYV